MNRKKNIIFFFLELISGIAIGLFGTYLVTPNKPKFDLNSSIIIGFLTFCLFALIGIGIVGFFHARINNNLNKFGIGIGKATLGIFAGLIIGGILSAITYSFLPYQISSFYIPILLPVLCGVIGFNNGIKIQFNFKEK